MRRAPTFADRFMERARISSDDMQQAIAFIDAALALDRANAEGLATGPRRDIARLALEVAAIIHYARPFTFNERQRKKRRQGAREVILKPSVISAAPRLPRLDLGPLKRVLTTKEARALHRDVLFIRHNIVAHANSRYFKVRLVKGFLPKEPKAQDFAIGLRRTAPKVNLMRLRANAEQFRSVFGIYGHAAALAVRKARKRLHVLPADRVIVR